MFLFVVKVTTRQPTSSIATAATNSARTSSGILTTGKLATAFVYFNPLEGFYVHELRCSARDSEVWNRTTFFQR